MNKDEILQRKIETPVELREERNEDGTVKARHIEGIVPYNVKTTIGSGAYAFDERLADTVFNKTLADGANVRALWNHNNEMPLASIKNGGLKLENTKEGLRFDITINENVSYARDVWENIRSGLIPGCSFGFQTIKETWTEPQKKGERGLRTLNEVRLLEVSPCTFPQYTQSSVKVTKREMFSENGIDLDKLSDALMAEERSDKDYQVIEGAISALQNILPKKEEDISERSAEPETTPAEEQKADAKDTAESRAREIELLMAEN